MPAEESTPAIVLRARDYAESDRIVTLLTRDCGKLGGIAKGAKSSRRRFERKLEPLTQVTLFFRRRPHGELVFITRAEPPPAPAPILDDDLGKIALASYIAELADALTGEAADSADAYTMVVRAFSALGRSGASAAMRQSFELNLLRVAGFGLEFARCRVCGNLPSAAGAAAYFVVARGGVVCARCRAHAPEGAVRLSTASAAAMAELACAPVENAARMTDAGAEGALALARFLGSILDRRLRSAALLDSLL
jgi:DNA repair protein RecO (recombination protein O)